MTAGFILLFLLAIWMSYIWVGENLNFATDGAGPPPVGFFDPPHPQGAILLAVWLLASGLVLLGPRRWVCPSCGMNSAPFFGSRRRLQGKAALLVLLLPLIGVLHLVSIGLAQAVAAGQTTKARVLAVITPWDINADSYWATPLEAAVRRRDKETILFLTAHGANINLGGPYERSPLNEAIKNGNLDMVGFLLTHGADIGLRSRDRGETPLFYAAASGNVKILSLLLAQGADPNAPDYWGVSPLHQVMSYDNSSALEVAKVLLAAGAKVNAQDNDGNTPLHCAVKSNGDVKEKIQLLLDHGADVNLTNKTGWTALHNDAENDHDRTSDLLLAHGAGTDIFIEAGQGRLEGVKKLVAVDPKLVQARDEHKRTPLHLAAIQGRVEICEFLLQHGADLDARDEGDATPLRRAAFFGQDQAAHFLVMQTGGPAALDNDLAAELLFYAAYGGLPLVMDDLLARGLDVNALIPSQHPYQSPLDLAAGAGHLNIVEKLIARGSIVNTHETENGFTPLHNAVSGGHLEVVKFLLEHGADPNARDKANNITPIILAATSDIARMGDLRIIKLLLDHGAQVNVADASGLTPLHDAAGDYNQEMAELLIGHGAEVNAVDVLGRTPLNLAGNNADLERLLIKHGAVRKSRE